MGRIIAIVTGANSGVGLGICKRLLTQLSQPYPPDAIPQKSIDPSYSSEQAPTLPSGEFYSLTLVLACRSKTLALKAREELLQLIHREVAKRTARRTPGFDVGEKFLEELKIDFAPLDLASAAKTLNFCRIVRERYPYVSHLFCNAGLGAFDGINWLRAAKALLVNWIDAVTYPSYKRQIPGVLSEDGLGWVWQCNLFGHYLLARNIRDLLGASPELPARVLWTSSVEALPSKFDPEDWQLVKTPISYEASKYETEIVAYRLNFYRDEENKDHGLAASPKIRHILIHPGVCRTSVFYQWLGPLLDFFMLLAFYIARYLGSRFHNIDPYIGAQSAIHAALVPLAFLNPAKAPVRYGTESDRLARSWVAAHPIEGFEDEKFRERMEAVGDDVIRRCDQLCDAFEKKEAL